MAMVAVNRVFALMEIPVEPESEQIEVNQNKENVFTFSNLSIICLYFIHHSSTINSLTFNNMPSTVFCTELYEVTNNLYSEL